MTIFQYLELFTTFAVSTEMPLAEMGELHESSGNAAAIQEIGERLASQISAELENENIVPFVTSWLALNRVQSSGDQNAKALQPLVDLAIAMNEAEVLKSPEDSERWLTILEVVLGHADAELLETLDDFDTLPSKYGILAIASGNGDRAARWYYTLSEEREPFFYSGLKMGNQLLRRLKGLVNPEDVEASELEQQPRLDLIETYLAHPFEHRLQPFYSKTFEQLISWKMMTPEELFERGDDLVSAHFRQGMAYLDLAREYRKAGRYKEALKYLDKGMTTRLQYQNRLGCYLLEKTIVHRDAGEIDKAWATMNKVPKEQLDQYNRELRVKVIASLSEVDR